jgi:hypothetical protein
MAAAKSAAKNISVKAWRMAASACGGISENIINNGINNQRRFIAHQTPRAALANSARFQARAVRRVQRAAAQRVCRHFAGARAPTCLRQHGALHACCA